VRGIHIQASTTLRFQDGFIIDFLIIWIKVFAIIRKISSFHINLAYSFFFPNYDALHDGSFFIESNITQWLIISKILKLFTGLYFIFFYY